MWPSLRTFASSSLRLAWVMRSSPCAQCHVYMQTNVLATKYSCVLVSAEVTFPELPLIQKSMGIKHMDLGTHTSHPPNLIGAMIQSDREDNLKPAEATCNCLRPLWLSELPFRPPKDYMSGVHPKAGSDVFMPLLGIVRPGHSEVVHSLCRVPFGLDCVWRVSVVPDWAKCGSGGLH